MVFLWNLMFFDVYIIVDLVFICQQSPYSPKIPLFISGFPCYSPDITCTDLIYHPDSCWSGCQSGLVSGRSLSAVWYHESSFWESGIHWVFHQMLADGDEMVNAIGGWVVWNNNFFFWQHPPTAGCEYLHLDEIEILPSCQWRRVIAIRSLVLKK